MTFDEAKAEARSMIERIRMSERQTEAMTILLDLECATCKHPYSFHHYSGDFCSWGWECDCNGFKLPEAHNDGR